MVMMPLEHFQRKTTTQNTELLLHHGQNEHTEIYILLDDGPRSSASTLQERRVPTKAEMDLRGFLPEMKTWSLSTIACAAGLVALSAGAGYCMYRRLHRERAPPVHTQPPHEPEDVLEQAVDSPVVLQVVEPNLQLMAAEPHREAPAVVQEVIVVQLAAESPLQSMRRPPHQDSSEEEHFRAQESVSPEQLGVPFMSHHLEDRRVTDIGLKLCALRQVFTSLLARSHNQNILFEAGKKIVTRLAAANNQDVVGVQLAYEALIEFLRRPSNQHLIEAELSGAQLEHYNFVDVFFELLLFGYLKNGSAPQTCTGGYLERLFSLIGMWDVDVWTPAAGTFFTEIIDQLTVLCEALFCHPVKLYSDPATLACAVLCLLRIHVHLMETQLMETL